VSGPPSRVKVRPAVERDLAAVARIEIASFADPWTPGALLGELRADALRLPLVAELDGRVVGYLMAWRVADQLHILNIAADRAVRRAGVGTAMLREAARRALADGLAEATLEVRRSNTGAQAFYHRHGFIQVGVREGYYADNGEDAIIMDGPLAGILADAS
jgi:ribosomal-protein-alanine acetyltransferase